MFTNVINILFTNVKLLFIFVNYKCKYVYSLFTYVIVFNPVVKIRLQVWRQILVFPCSIAAFLRRS